MNSRPCAAWESNICIWFEKQTWDLADVLAISDTGKFVRYRYVI